MTKLIETIRDSANPESEMLKLLDLIGMNHKTHDEEVEVLKTLLQLVVSGEIREQILLYHKHSLTEVIFGMAAPLPFSNEEALILVNNTITDLHRLSNATIMAIASDIQLDSVGRKNADAIASAFFSNNKLPPEKFLLSSELLNYFFAVAYDRTEEDKEMIKKTLMGLDKTFVFDNYQTLCNNNLSLLLDGESIVDEAISNIQNNIKEEQCWGVISHFMFNSKSVIQKLTNPKIIEKTPFNIKIDMYNLMGGEVDLDQFFTEEDFVDNWENIVALTGSSSPRKYSKFLKNCKESNQIKKYFRTTMMSHYEEEDWGFIFSCGLEQIALEALFDGTYAAPEDYAIFIKFRTADEIAQMVVNVGSDATSNVTGMYCFFSFLKNAYLRGELSLPIEEMGFSFNFSGYRTDITFAEGMSEKVILKFAREDGVSAESYEAVKRVFKDIQIPPDILVRIYVAYQNEIPSLKEFLTENNLEYRDIVPHYKILRGDALGVSDFDEFTSFMEEEFCYEEFYDFVFQARHFNDKESAIISKILKNNREGFLAKADANTVMNAFISKYLTQEDLLAIGKDDIEDYAVLDLLMGEAGILSPAQFLARMNGDITSYLPPIRGGSVAPQFLPELFVEMFGESLDNVSSKNSEYEISQLLDSLGGRGRRWFNDKLKGVSENIIKIIPNNERAIQILFESGIKTLNVMKLLSIEYLITRIDSIALFNQPHLLAGRFTELPPQSFTIIENSRGLHIHHEKINKDALITFKGKQFKNPYDLTDIEVEYFRLMAQNVIDRPKKIKAIINSDLEIEVVSPDRGFILDCGEISNISGIEPWFDFFGKNELEVSLNRNGRMYAIQFGVSAEKKNEIKEILKEIEDLDLCQLDSLLLDEKNFNKERPFGIEMEFSIIFPEFDEDAGEEDDEEGEEFDGRGVAWRDAVEYFKNSVQKFGSSLVYAKEDNYLSSGSTWDIKTDSSVDTEDGVGVEVASPKLYGQDGVEEFINVMDDFLSFYDSYNIDLEHAGVHIHHDVSDLIEGVSNKRSALANLKKELHPLQGLLFNLVDRERMFSTYCVPYGKDSLDSVGGKYTSINFEYEDRIEFRMKEGTTDIKDVANWVALTHNMVDTLVKSIMNGGNNKVQEKKGLLEKIVLAAKAVRSRGVIDDDQFTELVKAYKAAKCFSEAA